MRLRRGYGALFVLYLALSPLVLAFCLLRYLCLLVRWLYRQTYGNKRAARQCAERAIQRYQEAPKRAELEAQRLAVCKIARHNANVALARGDVAELQKAWQVLDANGGDYR